MLLPKRFLPIISLLVLVALTHEASSQRTVLRQAGAVREVRANHDLVRHLPSHHPRSGRPLTVAELVRPFSSHEDPHVVAVFNHLIDQVARTAWRFAQSNQLMVGAQPLNIGEIREGLFTTEIRVLGFRQNGKVRRYRGGRTTPLVATVQVSDGAVEAVLEVAFEAQEEMRRTSEKEPGKRLLSSAKDPVVLVPVSAP